MPRFRPTEKQIKDAARIADIDSVMIALGHNEDSRKIAQVIGADDISAQAAVAVQLAVGDIDDNGQAFNKDDKEDWESFLECSAEIKAWWDEHPRGYESRSQEAARLLSTGFWPSWVRPG